MKTNRMLALLIAGSLFITQIAEAQPKIVKTTTGQTEFASKAAGPAQDIYAIDKTGKVRLDLSTGKIDATIQMKNFSLPRSLMQKHYNEKYMETDRFPESSFEGKIDDWKLPEKDGEYKVSASGDFNVHGVTRKRRYSGTITKKGNQYRIDAEFIVKLQDHDITIPVLFFTKITEEVKVTLKYELK